MPNSNLLLFKVFSQVNIDINFKLINLEVVNSTTNILIHTNMINKKFWK